MALISASVLSGKELRRLANTTFFYSLLHDTGTGKMHPTIDTVREKAAQIEDK
ncbi:hypothetical protein [Paraflavitalea speifideaquila]|uniref:hypothetical protein n=1 Tax=Paraflavitalea speifideaquila TaxID=3076558 RepID=UPI0028E756FD|nr:hypothetical protein [Paraflavitalea speifideiaquila]